MYWLIQIEQNRYPIIMVNVKCVTTLAYKIGKIHFCSFSLSDKKRKLFEHCNKSCKLVFEAIIMSI